MFHVVHGSGAQLVSYRRTLHLYYIPIISEKYRFGVSCLVSEALHLLNYIGSRISEKCRFWWLLASEVSHLPLFCRISKNCRFITKHSGQGHICFLYGFRMAQNLPRIYNKCRFGAACVCSCSFELLSRQLLLLLLLFLFCCCGPPSLSPPPPSPPFSLPPHFSCLLFIVVAS